MVGFILQSIIDIANVSISLLIEVINGLSFLLVRNYEFVTCLVQLLIHCFNGVRSVIAGFVVAMSDFQDQYGDFCVAIVKNVVDVLTLVFRFGVYLIYSVLKLLQSIIDGVKLAIVCPIRISNFLIDSVSAIVSAVQSIPAKSIDLVIDGFSILGSLVLYVIGGVLSAIGNFVKSIFDAAFSFLGRSKIDNEFLNSEATETMQRSINVEACIGLLIVILTYLIYVIEPDFVSILYRKITYWRRRLSIFGSSLRNFFNSIYRFYTLRRYPINVNDDDQRRRESLRRNPLNPRSNDFPANSPNSNSNSTHSRSTSEASTSGPDPERYLCVVCQDAERSVMIENCRHVCMCRQCADSVFSRQRRCPICRCWILRLTDVYL